MRSLKALWTMMKLAALLGVLAGVFIVIAFISAFGGFILCAVLAIVTTYYGIKTSQGPPRPKKYYRQ
jgi:hypothetical protein